MIDVDIEECFPLAKAGERVNFPLSPATAWRWALRGIRPRYQGVQDRLRLETVLIGGRRFTSREAVSRFIACLSDPACAPKAAPSTLRARQIDRAARRAAETF